MYDVTDRSTFKNIKSWVYEVDRYAVDNVCKLIIGNKCDLLQDRVVSYEEAKEFADELDIAYIECSAKDNANVEYAFNSITKQILHKDYGDRFSINRKKPVIEAGKPVPPSNTRCFCSIL